MNWFSKFLTSSIGQKLIMSLTGLFLITFLVVHLIGNFQLLIPDGGETFNLYAKFMTTNPIIKFTSYGLYAFILLHAFQGWFLWAKNRKARGGERYAVTTTRATGTNGSLAKNMGALGTIIALFLVIHMGQFWFKMKMGDLPMQVYDGKEVNDLYEPVKAAFTNIWFVLFYVISMLFIGMHLMHGFQSAFQTLGLNHKKYTPFIKLLGNAYSILIPLGFAIIPIVFYVTNM